MYAIRSYYDLNQGALVSLLERARWEVVARGPGMDYFGRQRIWPALRKSTIDGVVAFTPSEL